MNDQKLLDLYIDKMTNSIMPTTLYGFSFGEVIHILHTLAGMGSPSITKEIINTVHEIFYDNEINNSRLLTTRKQLFDFCKENENTPEENIMLDDLSSAIHRMAQIYNLMRDDCAARNCQCGREEPFLYRSMRLWEIYRDECRKEGRDSSELYAKLKEELGELFDPEEEGVG